MRACDLTMSGYGLCARVLLCCGIDLFDGKLSTVALEAPFSFSPCPCLFSPWLWELVSMNWRGRPFPRRSTNPCVSALCLRCHLNLDIFQDIVRQWCLRHSPFEGLNVEHANLGKLRIFHIAFHHVIIWEPAF